MRNIEIAGDLLQGAPREVAAAAGEREAFTPAAFFKDAGTIIAACLGLGLLVQLLLG